MKFLPIVSVFMVSLILATTAFFFASSVSLAAPIASTAVHFNSVAVHHTKYV